MQMTSEHVCQLQSDKMDCQAGQNRCPLATPDGGFDDELGDRPYRCHVCHVGFKLKVLIANIDFLLSRDAMLERDIGIGGVSYGPSHACMLVSSFYCILFIVVCYLFSLTFISIIICSIHYI